MLFWCSPSAPVLQRSCIQSRTTVDVLGCTACSGHNSGYALILQSLGLKSRGWLQIEAGLDKASTGSSFIRDMTVLVLDSAAQGLEPRIVRGILERIDQVRFSNHAPSSCLRGRFSGLLPVWLRVTSVWPMSHAVITSDQLQYLARPDASQDMTIA